MHPLRLEIQPIASLSYRRESIHTERRYREDGRVLLALAVHARSGDSIIGHYRWRYLVTKLRQIESRDALGSIEVQDADGDLYSGAETPT